MNFSEHVVDDNATFELPTFEVSDANWSVAFYNVCLYVSLSLGLPGNAASAIVWLRLHKKNSSAVYLAAIAINDLVFLLVVDFTLSLVRSRSWFYHWFYSLWISTITVEPLLVLSFCVERLLAICWPLQVGLSSSSFITQEAAHRNAHTHKKTNIKNILQ